MQAALQTEVTENSALTCFKECSFDVQQIFQAIMRIMCESEKSRAAIMDFEMSLESKRLRALFRALWPGRRTAHYVHSA